jgi:hypothetical protein
LFILLNALVEQSSDNMSAPPPSSVTPSKSSRRKRVKKSGDDPAKPALSVSVSGEATSPVADPSTPIDATNTDTPTGAVSDSGKPESVEREFLKDIGRYVKAIKSAEAAKQIATVETNDIEQPRRVRRQAKKLVCAAWNLISII